jgi:hypothetical protein
LEEEVISRGTIAGIEWPRAAAAKDAAQKKCKPAFASYVGLGSGESRLDLDFLPAE